MEICAVRSLWRHREVCCQMASEHILHMQKSLSQMNLQIHHVLSDITGASGQAILDAILAVSATLYNWHNSATVMWRVPAQKVAKALKVITDQSMCSR